MNGIHCTLVSRGSRQGSTLAIALSKVSTGIFIFFAFQFNRLGFGEQNQQIRMIYLQLRPLFLNYSRQQPNPFQLRVWTFQCKNLQEEPSCMPDMQYRYHLHILVHNVHFLRVTICSTICTTKGFLTAVAHVEEPIFILERIIHRLHQACCSKRKSIPYH